MIISYLGCVCSRLMQVGCWPREPLTNVGFLIPWCRMQSVVRLVEFGYCGIFLVEIFNLLQRVHNVFI